MCRRRCSAKAGWRRICCFHPHNRREKYRDRRRGRHLKMRRKLKLWNLREFSLSPLRFQKRPRRRCEKASFDLFRKRANPKKCRCQNRLRQLRSRVNPEFYSNLRQFS